MFKGYPQTLRDVVLHFHLIIVINYLVLLDKPSIPSFKDKDY